MPINSMPGQVGNSGQFNLDSMMKSGGPNFGLLSAPAQDSAKVQVMQTPQTGGQGDGIGGLLNGMSGLAGDLTGNGQNQGNMNGGAIPPIRQGGVSGLLHSMFGSNPVSQANQVVNTAMSQMNPQQLAGSLLGMQQNPNPQGQMMNQIQQQQKAAQAQKMLQAQSGSQSQTPASQTLNLIKQFEGYSSKPYWDVNAYRAGYGSDTTTDANGQVHRIHPGMAVSEADSERDLQRRTSEFQAHAASEVGQKAWSNLPPNAQAALTSITYNYGSLPKSVQAAVQTGNIDTIAQAVRNLAGNNNGINAGRRHKEANLIQYGSLDGQ